MNLHRRDHYTFTAQLRNVRFLLLGGVGFLVGFVILPGAVVAGGQSTTTLCVDDSAPPGGDGFSWQSPLRSVQDALDIAANPAITTIKVAQGRYVPSLRTIPNNPRSVTFQMRNNLTLIGGYAGFGAQNPDLRDPSAFISTLSGDINGDDLPGFGHYSDNAYRVVVAASLDSSAALEGFVVSGGAGGGIVVQGGGGHFSMCTIAGNIPGFSASGTTSLIVDQCAFMNNYNSNRGGALAFSGVGGEITSCSFMDNIAVDLAGAVYIAPNSSVVIRNSHFLNNQASLGGGAIQALSSIQLIDCQFSGNSTDTIGGALVLQYPSDVRNCVFTHNRSEWLCGAVVAIASSTFTNCVFSRNSARGACALGVSSLFSSPSTPALVTNCSVTNNEGGGIVLAGESARCTIQNSIVWGNVPIQLGDQSSVPPPDLSWISVSFSDIQGGWTGSNNIDIDPHLLQPGCNNVRLAFGSPCIDAGNNSLIPPGVTTDLDGNPRILNSIVDMGAYEGGHDPLPPMACDDDLDQFDFAQLVPHGGPFNPTLNPAIEIFNIGGPNNSTASVLQSEVNLHFGAGGFLDMGSNLHVETSIPNGQFLMRVFISFTADQLGVFQPFDLNLTFFNQASNLWMLAPLGNIQNSPNHAGQLGDRILVTGTGTNYGVTGNMGDYGVFWNPRLQRGFAWANVDHATDFAFGVPLPPCPPDCAWPSNGIVDLTDLAAVLDAWGIASPASFTDINRDGKVNTDDLLIVINGWGPCP